MPRQSLTSYMLFEFGLRSSLLLIFFTHLCVYGFLFFKRGIALGRLSDKILGTFCVLSALFIFPWMSGFAGWYDAQPYRELLFYVPFIHALFFGPLLYLYLKSLTNARYRLSRMDWLHFLPGALYLVWCLTVALTDKLVLGRYYLMNGETDPDFDPWYGWSWSISILIYLILSIRYYRQYIVFSGMEFSFADAASFKWLRNFLYVFALLTILLISEHILSLFIEMMYVRSWYYFFAFALISYYMAISAYSAIPIIKLNFEPQLLITYTQPLALQPGTIEVPYQDQSWMQPWKQRLEEMMQGQKSYLEPELTLTELARKMGTNASLLSKVINGTQGKSFNDYINELRVREAIRLLNTPAYRNFSLLATAYDAGFNSKSTFNRAFKKLTGKNPKDYIPN
ncbi:MAG: AraC family transcriptional regulator [Chitinophagaceae bacterium]|nr:MAG: AraC family transcriptional regulator [Chitinophagaceae bacterium]